MSGIQSDFRKDTAESERRKDLTDRQIDELELAGGVEGGMRAGSAGGPGERAAEHAGDKPPKRRGEEAKRTNR